MTWLALLPDGSRSDVGVAAGRARPTRGERRMMAEAIGGHGPVVDGPARRSAKRKLGDAQIHLEFNIPSMPDQHGQLRGERLQAAFPAKEHPAQRNESHQDARHGEGRGMHVKDHSKNDAGHAHHCRDHHELWNRQVRVRLLEEKSKIEPFEAALAEKKVLQNY